MLGWFSSLSPQHLQTEHCVFLGDCAACGQDEDLQGSPPVLGGVSTLLPRAGDTEAHAPLAHQPPALLPARSPPELYYFSCTALKGAAGSRLLSDKEKLKTKARPARCNAQEAGLAGSTGLGSATQPGAELRRHHRADSFRAAVSGSRGLNCSLLWGFAVLCVLAPSPSLADGCTGVHQLQDAGERLEVTDQSSSRWVLCCPALLLTWVLSP